MFPLHNFFFIKLAQGGGSNWLYDLLCYRT